MFDSRVRSLLVKNSFQFLFFNDLSCYGPFATDNSLSRALILSWFHKL